MGDRTQDLEERIAHLERAVDDLSAVVARQDTAMEQLTQRVAMLMQREATRDADAGGGTYFADETPPHY